MSDNLDENNSLRNIFHFWDATSVTRNLSQSETSMEVDLKKERVKLLKALKSQLQSVAGELWLMPTKSKEEDHVGQIIQTSKAARGWRSARPTDLPGGRWSFAWQICPAWWISAEGGAARQICPAKTDLSKLGRASSVPI
ncbi:hypothetical protein Dimus_027990 [Dionaea muscipula]